jgi:TonB family protein
MRKSSLVLVLVAAGLHIAIAADVSKLVSEGRKLDAATVDQLEEQLRRKPDRPDDHVRLASYWSYSPGASGHDQATAARGRHILWLIEHDPRSALFQEEASRIYSAGPLADRIAFEKGRQLWLQHLQAHGSDSRVCANAAEWLRVGDPETAARLFQTSAAPRTLGYFYGETVLGITARDMATGNPLECSEELRKSAFARKALDVIEGSQDPALVSGAAFAFGSQAGILYADGKLDWDYTGLVKSLIAKAQGLDPTDLEFYGLNTELPKRGERPPGVIRVGGNLMQSKLIAQSQTPPIYPPAARNNGVEGTARLSVLIGLDGAIVKMAAVSGPPELITAAAQAVRNWRYEPTLLNGRPCYILTAIDVRFTLR